MIKLKMPKDSRDEKDSSDEKWDLIFYYSYLVIIITSKTLSFILILWNG